MKFLKISPVDFVNFDEVESVWFNSVWVECGFKKLEGQFAKNKLCVIHFNRNEINCYNEGSGGTYSIQATQEYGQGQEAEARAVYGFLNGVSVEMGVV